MARLRVVVARTPARMLALAANGLFPLLPANDAQPWPTLASWVVLRQGGLRDDFHALAAQHGVAGWFERPVCVFGELPERWGPQTTTPLTGAMRLTLLRSCIAAQRDSVFMRAGTPDPWLGPVDSIIGELVSEGVTADAFSKAYQPIGSENDEDSFEHARHDALGRIYRAYLHGLRAHGSTDARGARVRLANAIAHNEPMFARVLAGRRDVRIVGLADLRGGWRPLLAALSASPSLDMITIFATHPLELPDAEHVVDEGAEAEVARPGSALSEVARPTVTPLCVALEAPDEAREAELVAVRVRALIDAGAQPHRIAVVSREARPAVGTMCAALQRVGVPVTARQRVALGSTGPARALRVLLEGAAADWSVRALLDVAQSPLLDTQIDRVALQRLLQVAPDIATERARDVAGVDAFLQSVPGASDTKSLAAWYSWALDVVQTSTGLIMRGLATTSEQTVRADDQRAASSLAGLLDEWRIASATIASAELPVSAVVFRTHLAALLAEDVIVSPATAFGVVVAEALSVAWRAFDHVFITGLYDSSFPSVPPSGALLRYRDRQRLIESGLQLDPPDAWRARELELFRVLARAARVSLTLSWPATDADGHETVRSSYVDALLDGSSQTDAPQGMLVPGFPLLPLHAAEHYLAHARQTAAIEGQRGAASSAYNGAITDPSLLALIDRRYGTHYQWSATGIEELAKCSWHWLAKRLLGLDEGRELDDAIEPSVTGTIMHRALDEFYIAAREHVGGPVFLRPADAAWVAPLLERALLSAWNAEGAQSWLGAPDLRALVRAELLQQLQRYIRFECEHNEKSFNNKSLVSKSIRTGALHGELHFDDIPLTVDGTEFRLRGIIDRIDVGVDQRVPNAASYFVAIDYKSSKGSTPAGGSKRGWDDGIVLQVPLYAEVARQLFPDSTLARLEYRTLRVPEVVHQLQFVKLDKVGKGGPQPIIEVPEAELQFAGAMSAAAARIAGARRGEFAAHPVPSCGCSPYCPARDVCRIPGGPVDTTR